MRLKAFGVFKYLIKSPFSIPFLILLILISIYYQLFILGRIPFPGDLLVTSYSPWLDYYKYPVKNPLISDVFSQFYLWKYLAVESYKNLQWPLWNPYSFSGTPLLATFHSATLYPFNLLLLISKSYGWGIFIFSQTLLATFTMYLFLSLFAHSRIARLAGSFIFSLGGLMTTWLEFGTAGHSLAWLPLSFYALVKFSTTLRTRYLILLTLSLLFNILSGNVQVTLYTFVLVSSFVVIKPWQKQFKFSPVELFFPSLFILFSILIASPQLLPTIELNSNSIRLSDTYIKLSNYGLLGPGDALKFLSADFFGNTTTGNYWGFLNYSETSGFFGTVTIILLIYGILFLEKTRFTKFFLAWLFVFLLLTFSNPLSQLIYKSNLPYLTQSFASRMLFAVGFCISILSALALSEIIVKKKEEEFSKSLYFSLSILIGVVLGILISELIIFETIESYLGSPFYTSFLLSDSIDFISKYSISLKNFLIPLGQITIISIAFAIISYITTKRVKENKYLILGIILLIFLLLDLSRYFLKFNPFVNKEFIYPTTKAIKFLQSQPGLFRVGREHAETLPPNTWIAYNLYSIEGYDPLYLKEYGGYMHFLNGGDLSTGGTGRYAELSSNYSSPFIDIANVKYFIVVGRDRLGKIPGDEIDYRLKETNYQKVFQDKSAIVLENPNTLPRAYLAKNIQVATLAETRKKFYSDKEYDPRNTVIIENDLGINTVTGEGDVKIINYSSNFINLKTSTSQEELLVVADQYEKGWKAYIDKEQTPITRANLIFRGIRVPPGQHQVKLTYQPRSFYTGLKIAILALVSLSIFVLLHKQLSKIFRTQIKL